MQEGFWSGLGGQGAELRPLTEALLPLVVTYANGSNGRRGATIRPNLGFDTAAERRS